MSHHTEKIKEMSPEDMAIIDTANIISENFWKPSDYKASGSPMAPVASFLEMLTADLSWLRTCSSNMRTSYHHQLDSILMEPLEAIDNAKMPAEDRIAILMIKFEKMRSLTEGYHLGQWALADGYERGRKTLDHLMTTMPEAISLASKDPEDTNILKGYMDRLDETTHRNYTDTRKNLNLPPLSTEHFMGTNAYDMREYIISITNPDKNAHNREFAASMLNSDLVNAASNAIGVAKETSKVPLFDKDDDEAPGEKKPKTDEEIAEVIFKSIEEMFRTFTILAGQVIAVVDEMKKVAEDFKKQHPRATIEEIQELLVGVNMGQSGLKFGNPNQGLEDISDFTTKATVFLGQLCVLLYVLLRFLRPLSEATAAISQALRYALFRNTAKEFLKTHYMVRLGGFLQQIFGIVKDIWGTVESWVPGGQGFTKEILGGVVAIATAGYYGAQLYTKGALLDWAYDLINSISSFILNNPVGALAGFIDFLQMFSDYRISPRFVVGDVFLKIAQRRGLFTKVSYHVAHDEKAPGTWKGTVKLPPDYLDENWNFRLIFAGRTDIIPPEMFAEYHDTMMAHENIWHIVDADMVTNSALLMKTTDKALFRRPGVFLSTALTSYILHQGWGAAMFKSILEYSGSIPNFIMYGVGSILLVQSAQKIFTIMLASTPEDAMQMTGIDADFNQADESVLVKYSSLAVINVLKSIYNELKHILVRRESPFEIFVDDTPMDDVLEMLVDAFGPLIVSAIQDFVRGTIGPKTFIKLLIGLLSNIYTGVARNAIYDVITGGLYISAYMLTVGNAMYPHVTWLPERKYTEEEEEKAKEGTFIKRFLPELTFHQYPLSASAKKYINDMQTTTLVGNRAPVAYLVGNSVGTSGSDFALVFWLDSTIFKRLRTDGGWGVALSNTIETIVRGAYFITAGSRLLQSAFKVYRVFENMPEIFHVLKYGTSASKEKKYGRKTDDVSLALVSDTTTTAAFSNASVTGDARSVAISLLEMLIDLKVKTSTVDENYWKGRYIVISVMEDFPEPFVTEYQPKGNIALPQNGTDTKLDFDLGTSLWLDILFNHLKSCGHPLDVQMLWEYANVQGKLQARHTRTPAAISRLQFYIHDIKNPVLKWDSSGGLSYEEIQIELSKFKYIMIAEFDQVI